MHKIKCKNCSSEVLGKYCSSCGQLYLKKYTFHVSLITLLDALDIRRGIFNTMFRLFIQPGKLVSDFLSGKTKPYTNPITFYVFVLGFLYFFSELNILGISPFGGNQILAYLSLGIPLVLASSIGGLVPYFKLTWIELLFINFYFVSGVLILLFLSDLMYYIIWNYQLNEVLDNINILLFPYIIYYYGSVFKLQIHKTVTNFVLIGLFYFGYNVLFPEIDQNIENKFESVPYWVQLNLFAETELFGDLQMLSNIDNNPIICDLTGNNVRDVAILAENAKKETCVIFHHFREGNSIMLNLVDLNPESANKIVKLWLMDTSSNKNLIIKFEDGSHIFLKWNGNHYYVVKNQPNMS